MMQPQDKPRPDFTGWGSFRVLPRTIVALGHLGTVLHHDGVRDGPSPHARDRQSVVERWTEGREATCPSLTALFRQHSQSNAALASRMISQPRSDSCPILVGPDLVQQLLTNFMRPASIARSLFRINPYRRLRQQSYLPCFSDQSIFCLTFMRCDNFHFIANRMTDLLFQVGKRWVLVGNRWAILWLFAVKYLADTGPRCSSATCVQVVRIHERCV